MGYHANVEILFTLYRSWNSYRWWGTSTDFLFSQLLVYFCTLSVSKVYRVAGLEISRVGSGSRYPILEVLVLVFLEHWSLGLELHRTLASRSRRLI